MIWLGFLLSAVVLCGVAWALGVYMTMCAFGYELQYKKPCPHRNATIVRGITGEIVAYACPDCDWSVKTMDIKTENEPEYEKKRLHAVQKGKTVRIL